AAHLKARGLTGGDPTALVFAAPRGGALRYDGWRRRVWIPACCAVGLEGLVFHDLRRVNATALVAVGVDVKTAQARLGHSDPRLTLAVYAQATCDADRVAAERLGGRLMPPTTAAVRQRPRAKRAQDVKDAGGTVALHRP
ncbi:MAG TPA: tyrosine-type recombinase/integrase, partial [Acidimicrobiales bacterium]|nr:tyrosine-type recombinase/integrase [Acidimicrobiales bacterium]